VRTDRRLFTTLAAPSLLARRIQIIQYFQYIRHYGALSTGTRILPVAVSIAVGSVVGTRMAGRVGTRGIVVTGLALFGLSFAWIAVSATDEPYLQIAAQMVIMGTGLGLTSPPATESMLSVLPPAKAGNRLSGQRRHARGRRCPGRRRHRQRLHWSVPVLPGGRRGEEPP